MLIVPLFSFLAHLAALFSIRDFSGFFFSSLFLSCPWLMVPLPLVVLIARTEHSELP
jgi:hypothetical protein